MSVPMFLFGNRLSIALSPDFALRLITARFIQSLGPEDKAFVESLSTSQGAQFSFDDFETNFTVIDAANDSLARYVRFLESKAGIGMMQRFGLPNPGLQKHVDIISRLYTSYLSMILGLIRGNVHHDMINSKIAAFSKFLVDQIQKADRCYLFTLNYDLLIETILLNTITGEAFTDFCHSSGMLAGTTIGKYDFNPRRVEEWFDATNRKTELHHLHGSLSLFYDYDRNRVIKLKSDDIGIEDIYGKIAEDALHLKPAIITGGGKSDKIVIPELRPRSTSLDIASATSISTN